jgi:Uma2 family endonuclease
MQLAINEEYLPAKLTAPPMTDGQFAEFCSQYPDYLIEMTAAGEIVITPPNYSLTGMRNNKISAQLEVWSDRDGRGAATDSSGGFVLPNGARLAPDAAWTLNRRVMELPEDSLQGFWHLCPDFVIELRSRTDRLSVLRAKMQEWIDNGAQLAWMIDPEREAVEIYRPHTTPEIRIAIESVADEGPVEGFLLDLRRVWNPLGR